MKTIVCLTADAATHGKSEKTGMWEKKTGIASVPMYIALSDLGRVRAGCCCWESGADFVCHPLLTIGEKGPMIWIEEEKRMFVNVKIKYK